MRYRNTVFSKNTLKGKTQKEFVDSLSKHPAFKGLNAKEREDILSEMYSKNTPKKAKKQIVEPVK